MAWETPEGAITPDSLGLNRGRGALSNRAGRFERRRVNAWDDGWDSLSRLDVLKTTVTVEKPRRIITRNSSPDVPFDRSINAYRGCEHGCVYCYARPTHGYLGLSSGLDFETRLFAKPDAPDLLEAELRAPGYRPAPIAMGTNTDPYQPIEKQWRITRRLIEVLVRHDHPLTITTKSALVLRDIDLLRRLAARGRVRVALSVTTLDHRLARKMEPRASTPRRRIEAMARLSAAGIPTGVMVAPVIPAINDHEIEAILAAAKEAGAGVAGMIMLRLPGEVGGLFREWLGRHFPDRRDRVMSIIADVRGGRDNDPRFGHRMRGHGPQAAMIRQRFRHARRRLGLEAARPPMAAARPRQAAVESCQLRLF